MHIIDGFLRTKTVEKMYDSLPLFNWWKYNDNYAKKFTLEDLPQPIKEVADVLCKEAFCRALGLLTGYHDLVPSTYGGGVHLIPPGGRLGMHLDHNRSAQLPGMERKVNLILWFHPYQWRSHWGGELRLNNFIIKPNTNRLVIFKCSDTSVHGHPDPITGPLPRVSLAIYYFSNKLEDKEIRNKAVFK